jgi:two-component system cell cycle response regulator DivK
MNPQTLIIVDDAHVNRLLPCLLLKQAGHRVFECGTGEQAMRLMELYHVDQILLDIALPVQSGLEICQRIREMPQYAHIKLIAYTAHAQPQEVQQFLDAGFDAVLTKPISAQDILGLVSE